MDLMLDYDIFLPSHFIGDQGRLRQVMTNLLGNAVKFTLEGHVLIRVIGMPPEDGTQEIIVSIEDTGIGIAPEMIDHIFGEFNQAEDERNRAFEGTGLGLAITKQLIDLMGGEIWVDSEIGEGSCFSFRIALPLDAADGEPPLSVSSELRRVLIVEEGELNRSILERQLAPLGVSVALATSAEEALSYLDANPDVDAVLTDLVMPGLSGSELARRVRDRVGGPPVILLSSAMLGQLTAEDRNLFEVTLNKPVMRADLYAALNTLAQRNKVLKLTDPITEDAGPPAGAEVISMIPASAPPALDPVVEPGPFVSARAAKVAREATPASFVSAKATQQAPDLPKVPVAPHDGTMDPDPVQETDAPVEAPAPRDVAPAEAEVPIRKTSVLAAEDNKTNQLVFRKMVKGLNIDLRFANNGEEAVAAFEEDRPDMIFMDISMPKMDGMEATQKIRAREAELSLPPVPICALTAHAMDGDAERILAAGLDHYLTKPLKKTEIHARIEAQVPAGRLPLIEER